MNLLSNGFSFVPLEYYKLNVNMLTFSTSPTQKAYKNGPLSAQQRNAIKMAFRWWAANGL